MLHLLYIVVLCFGPIPYVPTPRNVTRLMVRFAGLKSGQKVCDLGSGNGRLLLEAAKYGVSGVGVEQNKVLIFISRLKAWLLRRDVRVVRGDLFEFDIRGYSTVFCFLTKAALERLRPRFAGLPSGTQVVTFMFNFEDPVFAVQELGVPGRKHKIFVNVRR